MMIIVFYRASTNNCLNFCIIITSKITLCFLVPGSVRLLRVLNAVNSSNEIFVFWNKPEGGDEIDQYYIEWYQNGRHSRSGYRYVKHKPKKMNYSFTISNLQPGAKYKLWIAAENSGGFGSFKTANVTTGNLLL